MIKIDDSLLEEIGLIALPKAERDQLLRQIYETLEMRVGMRLAERMSDQQLDEFEKFIDTNDEAGALTWLETNFPDYKQVVASELDKLKGEIKQDSDKILATMQPSSDQPLAANPAPASHMQQPSAQFSATPSPQPFGAQYPSQAPVAAQPHTAPTQSPAEPVGQPVPSAKFGQPVQPQPSFSQQQSNSDQPDDDTTMPPQQSGSIPPPPSF